MNYQQAVKMLRDAGLININKPAYSLRNFNKVAFHGRFNETPRTFLIKAMVCKEIHDRGDHFISEFELRNRKIDVFRIMNGDFAKYEVATNPIKELSKKEALIPGMEFTIDLNKLPSTKKLEKAVKKMILC